MHQRKRTKTVQEYLENSSVDDWREVPTYKPKIIEDRNHKEMWTCSGCSSRGNLKQSYYIVKDLFTNVEMYVCKNCAKNYSKVVGKKLEKRRFKKDE